MRMVKTAAVQMRCGRDVKENIARAEELVRAAAADGAQIILLPELFERQYFCQERRYEYYKDADGTNLGIYRKTHIPDDHYYQEKFYFVPGDTGFRVFETKYGTIGVGICWDQWFPETARFMAVKGAELLYYPTAIGSEPILSVDSMPHWRRCMQGHAASNLMPVIAANRVGVETVEPCEENGGQKSSLKFYGSSFITDNTGEIVSSMDRESEGFIAAEFDLEKLFLERLEWGLFRDRRPEMYRE